MPSPLAVHRVITPPGVDQYDELLGLLERAVPPGATVLDIGAGHGDNAYSRRLAEHAGRVIGVDPDPRLADNPYVAESFAGTLQDYAATDPEPVSAATAVYVLEHLDEPASFFAAARACLAPGGSLVAVTPNLTHYFGLTAKAAAQLGFDDWLLGRLRDAELVEHYHHPVGYRCNTIGALARLGAAAGFTALDVVHVDDPGVFTPYLPGPLSTLGRGWSTMVHATGAGRLYGTLVVRLVA